VLGNDQEQPLVHSSTSGVSNIWPTGQNRPVARLNPARGMIL